MSPMRRQFHERLESLEDEVLEMGQRVIAMVSEVMDALRRGDTDQAAAVAAADELVDERYRSVQEGLLVLIALESPVARDLRLVSALIHTSLHLERVGDLCVNIAEFVRAGDRPPVNGTLAERVQEMGSHAVRALERSMQSLAQRDVDVARRLHELDDPLDTMYRNMFQLLVQLACDEREIDRALGLVLVARWLERIGDHAVDIGDQVVFCATGSVGP
jgi:phosphate transport system protein